MSKFTYSTRETGDRPSRKVDVVADRMSVNEAGVLEFWVSGEADVGGALILAVARDCWDTAEEITARLMTK